jgi:hypothetical protein
VIDLFLFPIAAATMVLWAVWRVLSPLAQAHHWPTWLSLALMATVIAASVVLSMLADLRREIRDRQLRREKDVMQQRYPLCHVTLLSSGKWFLTDRSTGREYRPDNSER